MDKLKLAFNIVAKAARAQRKKGMVPNVLGVRGMLALMFDRIAQFSESDEDNTEYVLDLAVKAMFAMAECMPDSDDVNFDEDEPPFEVDDAQAKDIEANAAEAVDDEDEDDVNDPRWTKIPPGKSVRDIKQ